LRRYVNSAHVFHVRDAWPAIPNFKCVVIGRDGFGSMRPSTISFWWDESVAGSPIWWQLGPYKSLLSRSFDWFVFGRFDQRLIFASEFVEVGPTPRTKILARRFMCVLRLTPYFIGLEVNVWR
jgi:hypothetical protein